MHTSTVVSKVKSHTDDVYRVRREATNELFANTFIQLFRSLPSLGIACGCTVSVLERILDPKAHVDCGCVESKFFFFLDKPAFSKCLTT